MRDNEMNAFKKQLIQNAQKLCQATNKKFQKASNQFEQSAETLKEIIDSEHAVGRAKRNCKKMLAEVNTLLLYQQAMPITSITSGEQHATQ